MTNQDFLNEINKRRTFAIISHPDAGKTTITEKLLLLGQVKVSVPQLLRHLQNLEQMLL